MASPPTAPQSPHSPRSMGKARQHQPQVERRRERTLVRHSILAPAPMPRSVDNPRLGVLTGPTLSSPKLQDINNPPTVRTPARCSPQHHHTARLLPPMSRR